MIVDEPEQTTDEDSAERQSSEPADLMEEDVHSNPYALSLTWSSGHIVVREVQAVVLNPKYLKGLPSSQ